MIRLLPIVLLVIASVANGCKDRSAPKQDTKSTESHAPVPTNRVDVPAAVRRNLGITFAKAELRNVASTIRLPGQFELLPTARREYRATFPGRVELLVAQYEHIEAGQVLYRLDSTAWRDLQERIAAATGDDAATRARLESMEPLRASHLRHEESLAAKVELWKERERRLVELREAGGASDRDLSDVRATLNATEAELADVMEKDAELEAEHRALAATLKAVETRLGLLLDSASSHTGLSRAELESVGSEGAPPRWRTLNAIEVRAQASGIVESFGVTSGSRVDENALVLSTIQPELIRFRAKGLQSDLARLHDGLETRIVPPGNAATTQKEMQGTLTIGPGGNADERSIDLLVTPATLAPWARHGVSAFLEVILEGGQPELAIPRSAVARDGVTPIIFRRDPGNPDQVIRLNADLGVTNDRWIVVQSGLREGDEVVVDGVYQLMLATGGQAQKGGHFHSDGTFHEGEH